MPERKDYYAVLGIPKDASADDIKKAYRKLARKWHPDVNPGDAAAEERFKEISEAYHVLGDEERRRTYDHVGPEQFAQEFDLGDFASQFGAFFGGRREGGASAGFGMFEDLLGGTRGFGGGYQQGAPRPARGRDVTMQLELGLREALRGTERQIRTEAAGGGGRAGTRVRIPAGARDGTRVRLRGKGQPGANGGPPGDLFLEVKLAPDPVFRLEGDDLHTDVPITVYEAALGATIEVPTLAAPARIAIPAGTRGGQRFRVRGRGAPRRKGGGHGDVIVTVRIALPDPMGPEVVAMMETLRDAHPYDPRGSTSKTTGS